jgi:APA family basic amino acid/polyamine antiporter
MVLGVIVYFAYSRRNSLVGKRMKEDADNRVS